MLYHHLKAFGGEALIIIIKMQCILYQNNLGMRYIMDKYTKIKQLFEQNRDE